MILTHFDLSIQDKNIFILNNALDQSSSLAVGVALYTVFSNVLIANSKFTDNTAEIGGALFTHNSSLRVVESTYSYSRAGAMIIQELLVNTNNSTDYFFKMVVPCSYLIRCLVSTKVLLLTMLQLSMVVS